MSSHVVHSGHRTRPAPPKAGAGVIVSALVGAVLLLPFGFIPWGDHTAMPLRLVSMTALGLLMGACLGAIYLGDRLGRRDGRR